MGQHTERPVRPVRVWVGYALPTYRSADQRTRFCSLLGSIFMPATVQLMAPWGLSAYLPCIVPLDADRSAPDEVAVVFYQSTEAYSDAAHRSVGGRAYELLHQTLFDFDAAHGPASRSGFPVLFDDSTFGDAANAYFYLFAKAPDWQQGAASVQVCLYQGDDLAAFRTQVGQWAHRIQDVQADGLDVIFSLQDRVLVVWAHVTEGEPPQLWSSTDQAVRTLLHSGCVPVVVPPDVSADYAGIEAASGQALNLRFART